MSFLNMLLIVGALCGFAYSSYCQTKARAHISREKLARLKDHRSVLKALPPKTILTEEGLKYYKGYYIGIGAFVVCIALILLSTALSG
jgi:hypothetical protein